MKKLEPLSRLVLHDVARKFQPDETLAEGAVLAESFNRMKLRAEGVGLDEVATRLTYHPLGNMLPHRGRCSPFLFP